jgi:hypothetical protein
MPHIVTLFPSYAKRIHAKGFFGYRPTDLENLAILPMVRQSTEVNGKEPTVAAIVVKEFPKMIPEVSTVTMVSIVSRAMGTILRFAIGMRKTTVRTK